MSQFYSHRYPLEKYHNQRLGAEGMAVIGRLTKLAPSSPPRRPTGIISITGSIDPVSPITHSTLQENGNTFGFWPDGRVGDGHKDLVRAEAGVHRVNVQRCTETRLVGKVSKEVQIKNQPRRSPSPANRGPPVMSVAPRHFPQIIRSVLKLLGDNARLFFIAQSLDLHNIPFG